MHPAPKSTNNIQITRQVVASCVYVLKLSLLFSSIIAFPLETKKCVFKILDYNFKIDFYAHKSSGLGLFIFNNIFHNTHLSGWIIEEQHQQAQNKPHFQQKWTVSKPRGMCETHYFVQTQ